MKESINILYRHESMENMFTSNSSVLITLINYLHIANLVVFIPAILVSIVGMIFGNNSTTYLFDVSVSIFCPFFFHIIDGSGLPFGGPHSRIAVSPCATRVFCGSSRNSSLKTANKKKKERN